jgi:hypothetical protein
MLPTGSRGGGNSLLEKRVNASSGLGLSDSVSLIGDFNLSIEDPMLLDSATSWHNNHASDPATHTMNMADAVGLNADWNRPLESVMALVDTVHVILDGYHPAGEDLIQHDLTANETMIVGQPVYISSSNTVNLADATTIATANAIGLVCVGGSANDTVTIQTDGAVYQDDWTAVIGTANLTPGLYYLDITAGLMSTSPPVADGNTVVTLGTALNTKTLDIEVNEVATL